MSFVFVQLSHDYADEFDITGCFVAPRARVEADLAKIRVAFEEGKFESEECLEFQDFDDLTGGMEVQECTEEFYHEFNALTGGHGTNRVISDLIEYINEPPEK